MYGDNVCCHGIFWSCVTFCINLYLFKYINISLEYALLQHLSPVSLLAVSLFLVDPQLGVSGRCVWWVILLLRNLNPINNHDLFSPLAAYCLSCCHVPLRCISNPLIKIIQQLNSSATIFFALPPVHFRVLQFKPNRVIWPKMDPADLPTLQTELRYQGKVIGRHERHIREAISLLQTLAPQVAQLNSQLAQVSSQLSLTPSSAPASTLPTSTNLHPHAFLPTGTVEECSAFLLKFALVFEQQSMFLTLRFNLSLDCWPVKLLSGCMPYGIILCPFVIHILDFLLKWN